MLVRINLLQTTPPQDVLMVNLKGMLDTARFWPWHSETTINHDGLDITMKQFLHNQGGVPVARLVILPSTASDSESGSDSDGDHSSTHAQIE